MRPIFSGPRYDGTDTGDRAIEDYEALWQEGPPSLERVWAEIGSTHSLRVLGSLIKVDLQNRFDRGERPTAGEYLDRFPELSASGDRAVSLIYEEFCQLEERGESPDSGEFCERYQAWQDSLRSQLDYHRKLSQIVGHEPAPPKYPEPNTRFAKYHLRSILGTGGAARVYLATDEELGGRKVALKLSASIGREPSIMANLDHRSIVPVLDVTKAEDGLRGFCMPYRPGITLETLILRLGKKSVPRSAEAVWDALMLSDPSKEGGPRDERPGWDDFPHKGSYSEAVAWLGLALANALAYLHNRGVLHRDIKPANILLAYSEGPQLLDFNLAHAPCDPEQAQAALKGGTLPYMAPEQLRAFLDPSAWSEVESPADLYAVGLVLRGLLTGQRPEVPDSKLPLTRAIQALHDRRSEPIVPVRQFNPGVPPTLEAIIAKCLEFRPEDRYSDATELAEDLRRFLDRRPMKYADNPSTIERTVNFISRNRILTLTLLFLIVAALAVRPILKLLPPKPIAEIAIELADTPEFRKAVAELDSGDPESWARARDTFHRLAEAHPDLAMPILYESVAMEKVEKYRKAKPKLKESSARLEEASKKPDFSVALDRRLREDRRSSTLLARKGRLIAGTSVDLLVLKEALPYFQKALEIDPDMLQALGEIAEIERRVGLEDSAIRHLYHALEVAKKDPYEHPKALTFSRKLLLPLLTQRADAQLDNSETTDDRRKARPMFREVELTLNELLLCWGEVKPREIEYFREYYRAAIASGQASLEAIAQEFEKARQGFSNARLILQNLQPLVDADRVDGQDVRESIGPMLSNIEKRSRKFLPEATSSRPAED
ncbi:protein kinase domain-containing protein [Tundrisphaera lichenicola]|uniref:protein kinase domain-containing protein n=1 Tax=Tundrisphaera lichenicola TaxID=2029860 RepID=UPI003EC10E58